MPLHLKTCARDFNECCTDDLHTTNISLFMDLGGGGVFRAQIQTQSSPQEVL